LAKMHKMQVIRFKGKLFGKTQENQQIKEIKLVKEQNLIVCQNSYSWA
jgi:hypothetical protein